ncbi:MAG: NAD(P)-dependent glycerol-3-phosphate dehydrogenase [Saccharofermentans sp.]|jgi:glycerol-3-phosphate dehydrogenase (NAD(P)+)|nr:NAD(P)-dependent glycerol-3-phosphate dehydrogenase [Mageeibacillus sp.]MCI1263994.1 NAD(P)-dependent glycerol-3-phosphate dehydrogenase [Saccharofermentans sp.]MCI1274556.1 NAD(P)-dependent glycerol-3-phosphate dehydrogenase [Saccharofermentans sp.]MCI2043842.1 NAD(P)-dependent glycerol-3-phosphate dehydrogenase [Mageeibacillus sp.]
MADIGVLGAGTWGIALAKVLADNGSKVTVWSALPEEIDYYNKFRCNPNMTYMKVPDTIVFTKDIAEACTGMDAIMFAVPSPYIRKTASAACGFMSDGQLIINVSKGIEQETLMTLIDVIRDEVQASHPNLRYSVLSGPTHAEEVARDLPTCIVAASEDIAVAEQLQDLFMNRFMRVYTNTDIRGVEICGALKNIVALAAGICVGLGYGDNAKAALITRGLVEMRHLGTEMGCLDETFSGLTGLGDLIVTAMSVHSRNNRCGQLIGGGMSAEEAVKNVGMVVEGINAIPAALALSSKYGVDMPVIAAVNDIVNNGYSAESVARSLMTGERKSELDF